MVDAEYLVTASRSNLSKSICNSLAVVAQSITPIKSVLCTNAHKLIWTGTGQTEGNCNGRIENPGGQRRFAIPDDTEAVEVGEQQLDAILAEGYPPEHLPRQTHNGDCPVIAVPECEGEEGLRVARLVHCGEVRVVGEGAPGPADDAEATEILVREAQQDFE